MAASRYTPQVVAVIDTASSFGATVKQLKNNVDTLTSQMSTLLADAPETLDTLNEIAAAISDDPAFFSTMASANTTLQSNIDALATAAATARTALQTALQANIDGVATNLSTETTARGAAIAALDNTIATLQADVDGNEADADSAIAAVQADVDANEADRKTYFKWDSNLTKVVNPLRSSEIEIGNNIHIDPAAGYATQFDGNVEFDNNTVLSHGGTNLTATFAEINAFDGRLDTLEADPTTKTYVDNAISGLVDGAGSALDTLNELSAALGDDANFATTVTNQIAAVQADVDQNEADADAAIAAVQADVDQNESDADAADAALSARITTLEADPTTATAVAAVQADVDQNEADADAAIAAVQADVDQNEADADAAIAAVQADVDQNEADADAALALKAPLASPAFTGTTVSQTAGDTDPTTHTIMGGFPDLILKTNQGDFATHQNEGRILWDDAGGGSHGAIKMKQSTGQTMDFFVGGVTAGDKVMSIASDSVDVESLKIDGTAVTSTAAELNQLDGITLGTAAQSASGDFATAAQGAKADSALQSHQDISGKANLSGATFTGNVEVSKSFPDFTLKAGDEKRFLFSDAGGAATGGIKHVSTSLDFYASGIASGNKEFSVTADGIEVTNGVTLLNGLSEYSNDSDAATGGIPVGGLYRTMQLVKIRVS